MAKKDVPAIVSAMGVLLSLVVTLVANLKERGVDIGAAFYKLGTADGELVLEKIADLMAGLIKPPLLKLLRTVSVGGAERFVVADHFKVGNDKVKINWIGDNFKSRFGKKIERAIRPAKLAVQELGEASLDAPILAELGERAETSLAHFWALLLQQPNGEAGTLLTNGRANVCYVDDDEGVRWAVLAVWGDDGWCVRADSVRGPGGWGAGYQVFSR